MNYRISNSTNIFSELHSVLFLCKDCKCSFLTCKYPHTTHSPRVSTCSRMCVSSEFWMPAVRPRFPADPHLPARSQRSMAGCCCSTAPEEGQGGGKDKQERGERWKRGDILLFPGMLSGVIDRKMWRDLHFH